MSGESWLESDLMVAVARTGMCSKYSPVPGNAMSLPLNQRCADSSNSNRVQIAPTQGIYRKTEWVNKGDIFKGLSKS